MEKEIKRIFSEYYQLLNLKNSPIKSCNGIYNRYENPILTAAHTPPFWRYDFDGERNPYLLERLGINAVFNCGAVYYGGKFCLIARVEGCDRKSFFAVARSENGIDNFIFDDYPVLLSDTYTDETNVYDMRVTLHEDGYYYGIFCSECKDKSAPNGDTSQACAYAGIVRTTDLKNWERLPNLKTKSPQQRNVVLHPEFVNGKYMLYTRPQDGFIDVGNGGGICGGLCDSMERAVINNERLIDRKQYHTVTEVKNGAGAVPIKTDKGFIHIAHGVRNTAAGLRYIIYAFATDLNDPFKVVAKPSGYFISPQDGERIGDVSNVVFTNGAIVKDGVVYIYYAGSDTRTYVATVSLEKLTDYVFNTPCDPLRSVKCVEQRTELIHKNLQMLNKIDIGL